jgi:hypothetical protein
MNYLRQAKTRGGALVHILIDQDDYIIGMYYAESPKWRGWVPVRWSKQVPFYNGTKASGLDLIEDYTHLIV